VFDQCIYFNTTALARRLEREWSDAFVTFGLTPPQAFMLRAILDRPGLLQSELASELAIARPTATRALDALEAKRYVERRPTEGDGREIAVWPTAAANQIRVALNEASGAVTARLKRTLGPRRFTDAVTLIKGVRTTLD
jgi:MarR family transcriptional regulator, temperature-dependent positive regulator of motility